MYGGEGGMVEGGEARGTDPSTSGMSLPQRSGDLWALNGSQVPLFMGDPLPIRAHPSVPFLSEHVQARSPPFSLARGSPRPVGWRADSELEERLFTSPRSSSAHSVNALRSCW